MVFRNHFLIDSPVQIGYLIDTFSERSVAQPGSAPALGAGCRGFESLRSDQKLFRENALWLIENFIEDDVLKAEFYREAGNMEMAKALIEKASADDDFMKNLVTAIKEKISKGETAVFLIKQT